MDMELWIMPLALLGILAVLGIYVALSYFHVPANKIALVNWKFPLSPKISSGHTLASQWEQGWWAKHFGPGHHFFEIPFSRLFASIEYRDFVQIPANKFGLVEARDGKPLPQGQVVADQIVHKPGQEKTDFADGEYFLTHGGQRGYQLNLLPPGFWAINGRKKSDKATEGKPGFLWEIEEIDPEIILATEVGILISNIGEKPLPEEIDPVGVNIEGGKVRAGESVFILKKPYRDTPEGQIALRGIIPLPLHPGTHPVNTKAYTLERVESQPVNLFFDGRTPSKFSDNGRPHEHTFLKDEGPPIITTVDGYTFPIKFALSVVVPPDLAAAVVALGGEKAVIESLIVPVVIDIVRSVGAQRTILDFITKIVEVKQDMEFAIRVAVEGLAKAEQDMRLALGIQASETHLQIERAKEFGRKFDPKHVYPVEVATFRLNEINFEESTDERTREFVNVIAGRALAEEEKETLRVQTGREEVRRGREEKAAEADAQVHLVRARIAREASKDLKEATETLGGHDALKGSPLAHPSFTTLLTSLGVLAEGGGKWLSQAAPPPPAPTAEAPPEEEAVSRRREKSKAP